MEARPKSVFGRVCSGIPDSDSALSVLRVSSSSSVRSSLAQAPQSHAVLIHRGPARRCRWGSVRLGLESRESTQRPRLIGGASEAQRSRGGSKRCPQPEAAMVLAFPGILCVWSRNRASRPHRIKTTLFFDIFARCFACFSYARPFELDPSSTTVVWSFGAALAPIDPAPAHQPLQLFRAPFQFVGVQLPPEYIASKGMDAPPHFASDQVKINVIEAATANPFTSIVLLRVARMALGLLEDSDTPTLGSRKLSSPKARRRYVKRAFKISLNEWARDHTCDFDCPATLK
ncbi:hypothetical protein DFH06DRAFT_1335347 [Mycena polygramma]|nr:hypothetical protein DFH06DRAFT_1335347 [Mycena polygramma]